MRRLSLFLCMLLLSRPASAQLVVSAPAVEASLQREMMLMWKSFGELLKQVAALQKIVDNSKRVLKASNQIASTVRKAKEMYDVVRGYTYEEFVEDARRGLYEGFPELEELDKELRIAHRNALGVESGTFFGVRSYHDTEMQAALISGARYAFRASLYPALFPDAERYTKRISEAEKHAQYYFRRLGLHKLRAVRNAGSKALANKANHLAKDADDKQRGDLALSGVNAQANTQTMVNTQYVRDAKEGEIAEREAARTARRKHERELEESIKEDGTDLFEFGVVD